MALVHEKLMLVQKELKAPKGQFNSFGKYKYRSCEDILEAVKPINADHKAILIISDSITQTGERYYITATARFICIESGESIEVTASAREEETKKGMDGSQITGSASSYARKYALNGLYSIDDTKDSDATNKHGKDEIIPEEKKETDYISINDEQVKTLRSAFKSLGYIEDDFCTENNIGSLDELPQEKFETERQRLRRLYKETFGKDEK